MYQQYPEGVPNTVDCLRFSKEEIERFAAWWAEMLASKTPLPAMLGQAAAPPSVGAEHRALLDEKGKSIETKKSPLPWWASLIVSNREHFAHTAIAQGWGEGGTPYPPPEVWVPILMVQQPPSLHLLKGVLSLTRVPRHRDIWPEHSFRPIVVVGTVRHRHVLL